MIRRPFELVMWRAGVSLKQAPDKVPALIGATRRHYPVRLQQRGGRPWATPSFTPPARGRRDALASGHANLCKTLRMWRVAVCSGGWASGR